MHFSSEILEKKFTGISSNQLHVGVLLIVKTKIFRNIYLRSINESGEKKNTAF